MSASGFKLYRRTYGLVIGGTLHIAAAYYGMHTLDSYLDHRERVAIVRSAVEQETTRASQEGSQPRSLEQLVQEKKLPNPQRPLDDEKKNAAGVAVALGAAEAYRFTKCMRRTHSEGWWKVWKYI